MLMINLPIEGTLWFLVICGGLGVGSRGDNNARPTACFAIECVVETDLEGCSAGT